MLKDRLSTFVTALSAADWAWKIFAFFAVGASGVAGTVISKTSAQMRDMGALYWLAVGLSSSLAVAVILFFVKSASLKQSTARLQDAFPINRTNINPLLEIFTDEIINVSDLHLPGALLHRHKSFRRCQITGPGALGINGGVLRNCKFIDAGHLIALSPATAVTGVSMLSECTFEDCTFHRVTLLMDRNTAQAFAQRGALVDGLDWSISRG